MAFKIFMVSMLFLCWTDSLYGQNPPVLAVQYDPQPAAIYTAPAPDTIPSKAFHTHQASPLPATIVVLLAGLLTAAIMQTRR